MEEQLPLTDLRDTGVDNSGGGSAFALDTPAGSLVGLPQPPADGLAPSLEKRRLRAYLGLLAGDLCIILATFYTVSVLYFGTFTNWGMLEGGMTSAYVVLPLYLTLALYNGTYSRRSLTDWQKASIKAVTALIVAAALLNLLAFFAKSNAEFSRLVFGAGMVLTSVFMTAMRLVVSRRLTRAWGQGALNKLVILAGGPEITLPDADHLSAEEHGLVPDLNDPQALDRLSKYLRNMDQVVVSCSANDRAAWSQVLKGTGIRGEVTHQLPYEIGAIGVVHYAHANMSALQVSAGSLGIRARATKRGFDIVLSAAFLTLLSPLMLITALLIKLEDGGPVFFIQRRMGRGNGFFDILKFRSMRGNDDEGTVSASEDDTRVTRVGRFIRRASIDELPQLINVLKGDMSLVGPRPHALGSKAGAKLFWEVDRNYWQRHGLRPGITGLAQVRGHRGATDTETQLGNRLIADLEYMQGWSLWRDIAILAGTLRVITHERAF